MGLNNIIINIMILMFVDINECNFFVSLWINSVLTGF